jgi:hypothetical protein
MYHPVKWGYYLDKCIFHPAMFSPRQTTGGVVYGDGKMLPPPLWSELMNLGCARYASARCEGSMSAI